MYSKIVAFPLSNLGLFKTACVLSVGMQALSSLLGQLGDFPLQFQTLDSETDVPDSEQQLFLEDIM